MVPAILSGDGYADHAVDVGLFVVDLCDTPIEAAPFAIETIDATLAAVWQDIAHAAACFPLAPALTRMWRPSDVAPRAGLMPCRLGRWLVAVGSSRCGLQLRRHAVG